MLIFIVKLLPSLVAAYLPQINQWLLPCTLGFFALYLLVGSVSMTLCAEEKNLGVFLCSLCALVYVLLREFFRWFIYLWKYLKRIYKSAFRLFHKANLPKWLCSLLAVGHVLMLVVILI